MSISFKIEDEKIYLLYGEEHSELSWVMHKLKTEEEVTISRVFTFTADRHSSDLEHEEIQEHDDDIYSHKFLMGTVNREYYIIDKSVLSIKYDLKISREIGDLSRNLFASGTYKMAIFPKIDELIDEPIIIGGYGEDDDRRIPISEFKRLLKEFPNSTELKRYSMARIENILGNYLDTMSPAQEEFDDYLNKRSSSDVQGLSDGMNEYEMQKYSSIYNEISTMLENSDGYKEHAWQKKMLDFILLIFPKYIHVFEEVRVPDHYNASGNVKNRRIDFMLVDMIGNVDIIEIKRPKSKHILAAKLYRENYYPAKELSGTIMQVEKYLFHLNKWGIAGEKQLNKKYQSDLKGKVDIKITNPKAMVILGRSSDFNTDQEKLDFEIIRRKYENVMDIITYDDLLMRLQNIISRFQ